MSNTRNRYPGRRRFLKQSAALSAGAATISVPAVVLGRLPSAQQDASAAPSLPPTSASADRVADPTRRQVDLQQRAQGRAKHKG